MSTEPQRERVLVGTPVLDRIEQSNLPFRGKRRKEFIKQVRAQIRQRRTTTGVARKVSNATIGTAGQAAMDSVQRVLEEDIERMLDRRFEQ